MSLPVGSLPLSRAGGAELHPVLRTMWQHGVLPWADGILVCYDNTPVMAGPIVELPTETASAIELTAHGIEELLNQQIALAQNYPGGDELRHGKNVTLRAANLSWLAWLVVQQTMARTGRLPIVAGMPEAAGSAHYRDWEPWNINNNGVWKRLSELTEVINGPDIAFRPEWVPGEIGQRIQWRMMAGTTLSPYIPQTHVPVIDLTAPGARVTSIEPTGEWNPATTVYGYGSGEGAAMLISFARANAALRAHLPVLEDVLADGGNDDWSLLQQHVNAEVASRENPVTQTSVELSVDDPSAGLLRWWTGDYCQLVSDGRWMQLPAGMSKQRCIKRTASIGADVYTVDLQED